MQVSTWASSSEGEIGAGGAALELAPSHTWQVNAGLWQKTSGVYVRDHSKGQFKCPHGMSAPLLPLSPSPHVQCHSTATSITPPW